jgi:rhodanese-related sulfurtransferase
MKRAYLAGIVVLLIGSVVLLAAQEHPPIKKNAPQTSAARLHKAMAQGRKLLVIDVRTPKEFAAEHVPGAVNIPIGTLAEKIREMNVPQDTTIVTLCDHGGRSSRAAEELRKMGYQASSFCRIDAWKEKGYKVESGAPKPQ